MATSHRQLCQCQICRMEKPITETMPAELVRTQIVDLIRRDHPDWSPGGFICDADLNHYRTAYVQSVLEEEKGELSSLEADVVRSLQEHELLSANVNAEMELMEDLAVRRGGRNQDG